MSGIVGGSNNRGSGLIADLGTDGQVMTSAGLGLRQVYEAAAGGEVYSGSYYTDPLNSSGTHNVTGVGFQPDAIWVMQIANRTVGGISWGMGDGVGVTASDHCFTSYEGISAGKYDDASAHFWKIWENASDTVIANLTSMDSDGFTFTVTEGGTYDTVAGSMIFLAWKV
jgi:hypothetical protein